MLTPFNDALATWFYLGRIPKAPGTWGSLGGLAFAYAIFLYWHDYFDENISLQHYAMFTLALFLIGGLSAGKYDKDHGSSDSKKIVIDEVCGMMIALLPMIWLAAEYNASLAFGGWIQPLLAFGLFRLFDIWKPFPISYVDRHVSGGWGVMLDDVLAGFAAALCFMAIGYGYHELFPAR